MKIDSQVKQIYKYLKRGNKLTGLKALRLFGCMCLPRRITDIYEDYGVYADREMIKVKSGNGFKRVMEYQLKPISNGKNSNNNRA